MSRVDEAELIAHGLTPTEAHAETVGWAWDRVVVTSFWVAGAFALNIPAAWILDASTTVLLTTVLAFNVVALGVTALTDAARRSGRYWSEQIRAERKASA